ncbi:MAG: hypothetical protein FJX76_15800 [Armatimonadetes bacterium]|nr:hypothetical protein [Armatimonadota bacterium]
MNPLYYPAYEILVHIYEERSDRTRARATIERGVKALGEEPRIQRLAGVYYLNCEKKPARAAEFLEVALRAAPDDRVCQALLRQARKDAP